MNAKPQDFLKKSVYFSAKFVFLPMGAKTLSNAGLCWQLGAVEKIAPYGRSLLTREQQAQVDRGSDSHVFLRVARVWEKRLCLRGRGPGGTMWATRVLTSLEQELSGLLGKNDGCWFLSPCCVPSTEPGAFHLYHLLLTTELQNCYYYSFTYGRT